VIERAGCWTSVFFAYYEEADWCIRASRRLSDPARPVKDQARSHRRPEQICPGALLHDTEPVAVLETTKAGLGAWMNTLLMDNLRTLASWSLRPKWRGKRKQRDVMVRALLDYTFNRLGKAPYF
jgi:hypothetical protein